MKRIISLLLASLMILGLVSCKKESADIIYERIRENTLALEYIKLSLSVDSTVTTGDSTLTIPTDSDVKIIRQNGELSYQWYNGGTPVGENSNELTIENISLPHFTQTYPFGVV